MRKINVKAESIVVHIMMMRVPEGLNKSIFSERLKQSRLLNWLPDKKRKLPFCKQGGCKTLQTRPDSSGESVSENGNYCESGECLVCLVQYCTVLNCIDII